MFQHCPLVDDISLLFFKDLRRHISNWCFTAFVMEIFHCYTVCSIPWNRALHFSLRCFSGLTADNTSWHRKTMWDERGCVFPKPCTWTQPALVVKNVCQKGKLMQYSAALLWSYIFYNSVTHFLMGESTISSTPLPNCHTNECHQRSLMPLTFVPL